MESCQDYPLGKVCEGQPNIHENMKCSGKSNVYNQTKGSLNIPCSTMLTTRTTCWVFGHKKLFIKAINEQCASFNFSFQSEALL